MLNAFAQHVLGQSTRLPAPAVERINSFALGSRLVERGETIYEAGERVDSVFIVRDGWFATAIDLRDGGRQLLNFYLPVDVIGLEFMSVTESPTRLKALSNGELVAISTENFVELLYDAPALMEQMMSLIGLQDIMMQERICATARLEAKDKVAYFLLLLRSKVNDKGTHESNAIRVPLTQQDIADALGLTNVTVSRVITELEADGFLSYRRNFLEFHKPEALAERVSFTDRYARHKLALFDRLSRQIAA